MATGCSCSSGRPAPTSSRSSCDRPSTGRSGARVARPGSTRRRCRRRHRLVRAVTRWLADCHRAERRRHRGQHAVGDRRQIWRAPCRLDPQHQGVVDRLAARQLRVLVPPLSRTAMPTTATCTSIASVPTRPTIRWCSTPCPPPRPGPTCWPATTVVTCSCTCWSAGVASTPNCSTPNPGSGARSSVASRRNRRSSSMPASCTRSRRAMRRTVVSWPRRCTIPASGAPSWPNAMSCSLELSASAIGCSSFPATPRSTQSSSGTSTERSIAPSTSSD